MVHARRGAGDGPGTHLKNTRLIIPSKTRQVWLEVARSFQEQTVDPKLKRRNSRRGSVLGSDVKVLFINDSSQPFYTIPDLICFLNNELYSSQQNTCKRFLSDKGLAQRKLNNITFIRSPNRPGLKKSHQIHDICKKFQKAEHDRTKKQIQMWFDDNGTSDYPD